MKKIILPIIVLILIFSESCKKTEGDSIPLTPEEIYLDSISHFGFNVRDEFYIQDSIYEKEDSSDFAVTSHSSFRLGILLINFKEKPSNDGTIKYRVVDKNKTKLEASEISFYFQAYTGHLGPYQIVGISKGNDSIPVVATVRIKNKKARVLIPKCNIGIFLNGNSISEYFGTLEGVVGD